ncbi:PREDICTED: TD and POZ domain-containing protein 3-like [Vollenhovia emeryi]|uniref:TD and POZ domain-containing protein 3-like n=1 Tax=Vollenhovia emeryi TaxID=411798 RepID=UPI0005F5824B|nr:PREDICTED: TD and POZ domain-containing protein 3-like [Vollenhovia emeryi]XP_011863389.1 PREDICTED: TD and POZ domain-containing protein 3-like [Vollenhovia emeryi]
MNDTFSKMNPETQEVSSLFLPAYTKSYATSRIEMTTIEYTWKIENFEDIYGNITQLQSPPLDKEGQYIIKISRSPQDSKIQFNLCTKATFIGSCTTAITVCSYKISNVISGCILNEALLLEASTDNFCKNGVYFNRDTALIYCKIKVFHNLINSTVYMNSPSETVFKDVKSFEDSTLELKNEDEKSIVFIVEDEQYVISKKLLWNTGSSYFQNVCRTHKGKVKDMKDELQQNELKAFKQILLYILTGLQSVEQNYSMLKELLTTADKYDVPMLKITCEHYLLYHLKKENAVELLQHALSSNASSLQKHSATFIKFHMKELMDEELPNPSQEDLIKIMILIEKLKIEIHENSHSFSFPKPIIPPVDRSMI